jgi:hypothetical protein
MSTRRGSPTQVGKSTFFNNQGSDLTSKNVEDAIKELEDTVATSASPGFTWGKQGNASNNTWLENDGVPSNRTGRTTAFVANPEIQRIFTGSRNLDTYDLSVYEHDGNQINLTLLTTVSVVNSRTGNFGVSVTVTNGKQLATRITSGSAKDVVVGVILKGTT